MTRAERKRWAYNSGWADAMARMTGNVIQFTGPDNMDNAESRMYFRGSDDAWEFEERNK